MNAAELAALAAVVAAMTGLVNALATAFRDRRIVAKVEEVRTEVTTANGQTLAALADAREGRRIEADVPPGERTHSDKGYVRRLHEK